MHIRVLFLHTVALGNTSPMYWYMLSRFSGLTSLKGKELNLNKENDCTY